MNEQFPSLPESGLAARGIRADLLALDPARPKEMAAIAAHVLTGEAPEALQAVAARAAPPRPPHPAASAAMEARGRLLLTAAGCDPAMTARYLRALWIASRPDPAFAAIPPAEDAIALLLRTAFAARWTPPEAAPELPPPEGLSRRAVAAIAQALGEEDFDLTRLFTQAPDLLALPGERAANPALRLAAEALGMLELEERLAQSAREEIRKLGGGYPSAQTFERLAKSLPALGVLFDHLAKAPRPSGRGEKRNREWFGKLLREADPALLERVSLDRLGSPDADLRKAAVAELLARPSPEIRAILAAHEAKESGLAARGIREDADRRALGGAPEIPDDAEGYAALGGARIAIPPLRPFIPGEVPVFGAAEKAEILAFIAAENASIRARNAQRLADAPNRPYLAKEIDEAQADGLVDLLNGGSFSGRAPYDQTFQRLMREGRGGDWLERALSRFPQREGLLARKGALSYPPPFEMAKASCQDRADPWDAPAVAYVNAPNADLRQVEALAVAHGSDVKPGGYVARLIDRPDRAEAYPHEALWPLIATHLDVIAEAFSAAPAQGRPSSKSGALRLLRLLPATPRRFLTPLLEIAAAPLNAPEREEARALLAAAPGLDAHLAGLLQDARQEIRLSAAGWMARRRRPESEAPLRAALRKEKAQAARAALLEALAGMGADLSEWLGPAVLLKEAEAGARRPLADPPEALTPEAIGPLRWRDGSPLPEVVLRWWLHLALRLNKPGDGMIRLQLDQIHPDDAADLGLRILGLWPFPERGLLALALKAPAAPAAEIARRYVKDQAKWDPMGCMALLGYLGGRADAEALQILLTVSEKQKQAGQRKLAASLVARIAEDRGWTTEEIADRLVPTAGLDASGKLDLSCGEGKPYLARIDEKLDLALFNPEGRRVKAPPAGEEEARKLHAAARKALKSAVEGQTARLRDAMLVERRWSPADWREAVLGHPVLRKLAERLVWLGLDAEGAILGSFRPTPEGEILDAAEAPADPDSFAAIKLAHEVLTGPEAAALWSAHLKDYEIASPFPQFDRPILSAPADAPASAWEIADLQGRVTDTLTLRKLAKRLGYVRGAVLDSGGYHDYLRFLPGGLIAVFGFSGDGVGALPGATFEATVGSLSFARDREGKPGGKILLERIPPVLLSELRRDYRAFAEGSRPQAGGGT